MRDEQLQVGASGMTGGPASAMRRGLVATAAYVGAAVILTSIGYLYGVLFDIRPEFPFILTLPFLLGVPVVMVAFSLAGLLADHSWYRQSDSLAGMAVGSGFGAMLMALVWLVTSEPVTDISDWPELLYLLQLAFAGIAAGMTFFSGLAGWKGRVFLMTTGLCLLMMLVPFLLIWHARRGFENDALQLVSARFRLPADFHLTVSDESSGFGSLEKNVRFKAAGDLDESGRHFSVVLTGQRSKYEVDIKEIHASLKVPEKDIPGLGEWNDSEEGRRMQKAVLDLASAYINTPLTIISVKSESPSGKFILMQGHGVEVVARPGSASPEMPGADFTFTVASG
ncbi:MAG: hypothetical protein Q7K29_09290 [Thermoleophilia bacterium]|nr:hypothetical protein [Thermoleophilia bacterium]